MVNALSPVAKACSLPQFYSCPRGQQTIHFFGLEDSVISHNMRADARGNTLDVASVLLQNSAYEASDEGIAGKYAKDPSHFERWCRLPGLLIEINDADYAEPKLAVVS